jgi:hypothetical protein
MSIPKAERAGVGFVIGRQNDQVMLKVHFHHDTISLLRDVRLGFELLNGITLDQAKKLQDILNENIIGVFVTTASDDKAQSTAG